MFLFLNIFIQLTLLLFFIGLLSYYVQVYNILLLLLGIELMLLALNVLVLGSSLFLDDLTGQIIAFVILTVSAAEAALALAIVLAFYRKTNLISLKEFSEFIG